MWILTTLFVFATLVLIWLCAGYFVSLCFASFIKRRRTEGTPTDAWPTLSIVVPCYNEADLIVGKLENLLACDYPQGQMEIVFVDGGSSDGTVARLAAAMPEGRSVRVLQCPRRGKIAQLNHALPKLRGDIIVNTDADARLQSDTLRLLVAEFDREGRVGVVGAFSHMADSIWRDKCFWDSQNKGRLIESDASSSSIVIATCYAFQKGLLEQLPEDVVADDVYVAFLANSLGRRVVYSRRAIVEELRGPRGLSEFLSHKFRKNNAFLRESLRFLYRLPEMSGYVKMMMLTRIGQQLFIPWAAGLWCILALTLILTQGFEIVVTSWASLALMILVTSRAFHSVEVPPGTTRRYGLFRQGAVFLETMFVLFAAALTYPFYRQGSSYARLGRGQSEPTMEEPVLRQGVQPRKEDAPTPAARIPAALLARSEPCGGLVQPLRLVPMGRVANPRRIAKSAV